MGRPLSFSKGKNNTFFQSTAGPPDQPEAPPKGNLLGVGDQRTKRAPAFGVGFTGKHNQGVTRKGEPPPKSQGGYFTTSRPYQANWGLKNGLQRRTKR